jgi:MSHA biogenesis protein MshO
MSRPRHAPGCRVAHGNAGFTLVELLMVIIVTGIVASSTAVFISGPVSAYYATVRRAQLSDTADTALRRFARDIESALPNSVRLATVGGVTFIEFIPTVTAGHYRSAPDPSSSAATLDFTNPTGNSFQVVGPYDTPAVGNQIVIFNLGPGVSASDAYAGTNRRAITAVNTATNTLSYSLAGGQFPFASPSDRYFVVNTATTYVCNPSAGTFSRYTGYAIQATQPTSLAAAPLSTATQGVLATDITACAASLTTLFQSHALVTVYLTLASAADSLSFYQEAHVPNTP